jgi:methyltransferase (TIGR00027 family)
MVAACRGFAAYLPPDAQLAVDPFGVRFAGPHAQRLDRVLQRAPWLGRGFLQLLEPRAQVLWLQLRTRSLDDIVRSFVRDGGRQLLLLGAGFDCRAARLREVLGDSIVFEVDHPATQAVKREVLASAYAHSARVEYLPWNFERDALADLPAALRARGHDPKAPTLTLWEGVVMYLSLPAIEATLQAVRALSAERSLLAMTYIAKAGLARDRLVSLLVARAGEPWTFGWEPAELPGFLEARGFELMSDRSERQLASELLPARYHAKLAAELRHVALASVRPA